MNYVILKHDATLDDLKDTDYGTGIILKRIGLVDKSKFVCFKNLEGNYIVIKKPHSFRKYVRHVLSAMIDMTDCVYIWSFADTQKKLASERSSISNVAKEIGYKVSINLIGNCFKVTGKGITTTTKTDNKYKNLEIGESCTVKLSGSEITNYRQRIYRYQKLSGFKFVTETINNGIVITRVDHRPLKEQIDDWLDTLPENKSVFPPAKFKIDSYFRSVLSKHKRNASCVNGKVCIRSPYYFDVDGNFIMNGINLGVCDVEYINMRLRSINKTIEDVPNAHG